MLACFSSDCAQRPNCEEMRFVAFQIWHFILSDMGSISSLSSSRTVYPAPQRTALPSSNYLPPLYLSSNPLSRLPASSMASTSGWHHFLVNQHSNSLALVSLGWRCFVAERTSHAGGDSVR